jgi:WD40 repeat protein
MQRLLGLIVLSVLLCGCGDLLVDDITPDVYWPATPCPQHNTQDADDVCLITHPYQTDSYKTSLSTHASAITADGRWIAVGGLRYDGAEPTPVLLIDLHTGEVTEVESPSGVGAVAFSSDGAFLAAESVANERQALVRLWAAPSGAHLRDLTAPIIHDTGVTPEQYHSIIISLDGRQVIAGRSFGDIVIWDTSTGAVVRTLTPPRWGDGPDNMRLSADGTTLVVAAQFDGSYVTVYDLPSGTVVAELDVSTLDAQSSWPQDVALSPDGETVAIAANCRDPGCGGVVWLWNLQTQDVRPLQGHVGDALSVIFHPDGRWLASGGMDNSIRIWDWRSGRELYQMQGPLTPELTTGTPGAGVPSGAGRLVSATQGLLAPVDKMSITADGSVIVYSESANGQTRVWRLPKQLWQ